MRYSELFEKYDRSRPCIVVDVQPSYTGGLGWVSDLMEFLNMQRGSILMFINAEESGLTEDTRSDVVDYWDDNGFDNWDRVDIIDKGYGYFRGWMDNGIEDNIIIRVIREMYSQGVNDSRELFGGEDGENYIDDMNKLGVSGDILNEPLIVDWVSISKLKEYDGCYIMGGGRNECLREVELLMNAFNIKYRRIERFVYG